MRNLSAITLFPGLIPSPPQDLQLGPATFRPFPQVGATEKGALGEHLTLILNGLQRRQPIFVSTNDFADADSFWAFEDSLSRASVPYKFALLSYPMEGAGGQLRYENCDRLTFTYRQGSDPATNYGYDVFRDGKHEGFAMKDHWPLVTPQGGANFKPEVLQAFSAGTADNRLHVALEWFNKSYKTHQDDRDQLIALSIALEALVGEPSSTKRAEEALHRAIYRLCHSSDAPATHRWRTRFAKLMGHLCCADVDAVVTSALAENALAQSITRSFREAIRDLTGSERVGKAAGDFYAAGCRIRHGGAVLEGESAWQGKDAHLFRPEFGRRLFYLAAKAKHLPLPARKADRDVEELLRKFEVQRLENMLLSDRARIEALEKIFHTKDSAETKIENASPYLDFLNDRSAAPEWRRAIGLLKDALALAKEADQDLLSEIEAEASAVVEFDTASGAPDRIEDACGNLFRAVLSRDSITTAHRLIFQLSEYCESLLRLHAP